ncbi:MAG: PTS glucose transporter subunit IIA [Streptococcaceae bacterium]|jgi:PTS system beta-glucosides-specific IIA component|nr:PTS glucose transporter subunit IIA [Streptococcaceae bacterium]
MVFGFGKKKELKADDALYAPFSGKVLKLEEVSDPVFSKKMMGDGYAIVPTDNAIKAPVSATVTLVQGHAFGFTRADGLEVLLHVGIDTVSLNGAPFKFTVKQGDIVDGGQSVGTVDWAQVEAAGLSKETMVIFTGMVAGQNVDFSVTADTVTAGAKVGTASVK